MAELKINLDPNKIFGKLLDKLDNMRPLMKRVSSDLLDTIEKNFEAEGRPKKWLALARSTIRERTKLGYWPGKILQRRGGAEGLLGSNMPGYDDTSAWVSNAKEYAAIHQFGGVIHQAERSSLYVQKRYQKTGKKHKKGQFKKGTEFGKGFLHRARTVNIPARPFMVLPDEDLDNIKKTVHDYLIG